MKTSTFFYKLGMFLLLNMAFLAIILFVSSGRHRHIHLPIDHTESNLFVIGHNQHYRYVFLGTSRGRVFSRDGNHEVVESILGGKIANLSKGGGGGVMPAEVHLNNFYHQGNSTDEIIYFIDPWVFFAAINNENNTFFLRDEPFELSILLHLIKDGFPLKRICAYLQMIPDHDWPELSRYKEPGMAFRTLKAISPQAQEKARKNYLRTYKEGNPDRYFKYAEKIIEMAEKHGNRITFITLPILMDDFPGAVEVDRRIKKIVARHANASYRNLITVMHDRRFFYDHMHFNRTGITTFTQKYLLQDRITSNSATETSERGSKVF